MFERLFLPAAPNAVFLITPALFVAGAWFFDRRSRHRRFAASRRFFALALYSAFALGVWVCGLLFVPHTYTPTQNDMATSLLYVAAWGWVVGFPALALGSVLAFAIAGLIARHLSHADT